jgi:hypothetical protein
LWLFCDGGRLFECVEKQNRGGNWPRRVGTEYCPVAHGCRSDKRSPGIRAAMAGLHPPLKALQSASQKQPPSCSPGCSLEHSLEPQQPKNQPNPPNDMPPSAPQRRPFRPHSTCLYRLVLTRSRCPQLPKANHLLAHLALLVGPARDPLPSPAQQLRKIRWGGGVPPPAPPPAPLRGALARLRPPQNPQEGGV